MKIYSLEEVIEKLPDFSVIFAVLFSSQMQIYLDINRAKQSKNRIFGLLNLNVMKTRDSVVKAFQRGFHFFSQSL